MEGGHSNIPGGSVESGSRMRAWLEIMVAVVLTVAVALIGFGFVINAVAPARGQASISRGGAIAAVVICAGVIFALGMWIVHAEHRLRRGQPVADAFGRPLAQAAPRPAPAPAPQPTPAQAPPVAAQPPTPRPAIRARRGRRHYGPVGTGIGLVLYSNLTIVFTVLIFTSYSDAQRSSDVQSHGIHVTATVQSVDNIQHCGRGGCYYTSEIAVTYSPSVHGVTSGTVHDPSASDLSQGDTAEILVDPDQPDYAEFPGQPATKSWEWVIFAVAALFCAVLTVGTARLFWTMMVHRRQVLASPAGA